MAVTTVSRIVSVVLLPQAGQPFCCYVVLPMFPEGIPTTTSVQNILLYQHNTMRMMYKRIAEAILQNAGLADRHPTDYLQFYCLGNREPPDGVSLCLGFRGHEGH